MPDTRTGELGPVAIVEATFPQFDSYLVAVGHSASAGSLARESVREIAGAAKTAEVVEALLGVAARKFSDLTSADDLREGCAVYEEFLAARRAELDRVVAPAFVSVEFDREGFRGSLERAGYRGKSLSDCLTRAKRAHAIIHGEGVALASAVPGETATRALEACAEFEAATPDVKGQLKRAVRDYVCFLHDRPLPGERTPGGQRGGRRAPEIEGFDREGFRLWLEDNGFQGKKISDLLTRAGRVGKLVGESRFAEIKGDGERLLRELEGLPEFRELSKDVQGQLRRAARVFAEFASGRKVARQSVVSAKPGRPPSAKSRSDDTIGVTRKRKRPGQKTGKPRLVQDRSESAKPKKPKAMSEAERQKQIDEFLARKGATECKRAWAHGSVPMVGLGLD